MNFAKFGVVASVPSVSVTECAGVLVCASNANMVAVVSSILPRHVIIRSGILFSSSVLSVPPVSSQDRVSAVRYLILAQCSTSKTRSDRQSRYCASLLVTSAKFKIHQRNL